MLKQTISMYIYSLVYTALAKSYPELNWAQLHSVSFVGLSSDAQLMGFTKSTSPLQRAKRPYLITQLQLNRKRKQRPSGVKENLEMRPAKLFRHACYPGHKGLFLLKKVCFLHFIVF